MVRWTACLPPITTVSDFGVATVIRRPSRVMPAPRLTDRWARSKLRLISLSAPRTSVAVTQYVEVVPSTFSCSGLP